MTEVFAAVQQDRTEFEARFWWSCRLLRHIASRIACYYAQRASADLIISEVTQVSLQGQGYAWTLGIHSPEQIEAASTGRYRGSSFRIDMPIAE